MIAMSRRKLYTQIRNEWRSNLWLVIELMIVSSVIWYIADYLYCVAKMRLEPTGFDTEHVYKVDFGFLPEDNPQYTPYDESHTMVDELTSMLRRLRERPDVEAVSYSNFGEPYYQNNYGDQVTVENDTLYVGVSVSLVSPEQFDVFRYRPADGYTVEELKEILRKGDIILSDNGRLKNGEGVRSIVNRRLSFSHDSTTFYTVGGLMKEFKRTVHEPAYYRVNFLMPLLEGTESIRRARTLNIRVRPDDDHDFISRFNDDRERLYNIGNMFITNIQPYSRIRMDQGADIDRTIRYYVAGMVFMLASVFLGLLGTFWFRTQQRVSESAIRMVNGATRADIFRRLIGEGMLLLTIATIPSIVIDIIICHYELNLDRFVGRIYGHLAWGRLAITVLATYAVMSLMIVAGIFFPARKAMKVDPAMSLHDD